MKTVTVVAGYDGGPFIARDSVGLYFLFQVIGDGQLDIDDVLYGQFDAGAGSEQARNLERHCIVTVESLTSPNNWKNTRAAAIRETGNAAIYESDKNRPR